jgi:hypothetical protein
MVLDGGCSSTPRYVGDLYGTPAAPVDAALAAGRDVLLEIELDGARQVKERRPEAVMIFIAPPSLAELERRLRGRGTDSEREDPARLARARDEIQACASSTTCRQRRPGGGGRDLPVPPAAERARAFRLSDDEVAAFLDG